LPDPNQIAAIVLAAGFSRRFGSDKLLHPLTLNGVTMPLAAHALLPWLQAFAHITVVVRPGSGKLSRAVIASLSPNKAAGLHWLECRHAARGMGASLAYGVSATHGAAGWMIGLADMPAVPAAAITGVRNALLAGADLAAASCNGRRGHPVGFASRYRDELLALQEDKGARDLLVRDKSNLVEVEIASDGITADIDFPANLRLLEQQCSKEDSL
jgi:molybdenum cofactor cytidylyltransferase